MEILNELEPKIIWKNFFGISAVPRCSRNDKLMIQYLKDFADGLSLEWEQDEYGNIVIRKPSTPGCEDYPIVVLQSHMDMVCEKNSDCDHDFKTDPISMIKDGEFITANGTTLGADNGIGMAFGLAVLESDNLKHGPIEVLLTREEEVGLIGATALSENLCKGRLLINIDSDEDGIFYIGCAGGINSLIRYPVKEERISSEKVRFSLTFKGLLGGHSGVDVHLGRGHALNIALRFIEGIREEVKIPCYLSRIQGGQLHNAIPRESYIDISVDIDDEQKFNDYLIAFKDTVQSELKDIDPEFDIDAHSGKVENFDAFTEDTTRSLLALLGSFPNGVIEMSTKIPDLVQTSSNLAAINRDGDEITVLSSQRSSKNSRRDYLVNKIGALGHGFNAKVSYQSKYPAWDPNPDSALVKLSSSVFEKVHRIKPQLKAIHAGLECGVIGSKYEGMDMISFGPDIIDAHSPKERVRITSVERYWNFVKQLLQDIDKY